MRVRPDPTYNRYVYTCLPDAELYLYINKHRVSNYKNITFAN